MGSGLSHNVALAFIVRKRAETVTVKCPYCLQEHEHYSTGVAVAICGQGEYSIIEPMKRR